MVLQQQHHGILVCVRDRAKTRLSWFRDRAEPCHQATDMPCAGARSQSCCEPCSLPWVRRTWLRHIQSSTTAAKTPMPQSMGMRTATLTAGSGKPRRRSSAGSIKCAPSAFCHRSLRAGGSSYGDAGACDCARAVPLNGAIRKREVVTCAGQQLCSILCRSRGFRRCSREMSRHTLSRGTWLMC